VRILKFLKPFAPQASQALFTAFVGCLLFQTGCNKKLVEVPIPVYAPSALVGNVSILNEFQAFTLPIPNDGITARLFTATTEETLKTDGSGNYAFNNLNPGTYTIEITAAGFTPISFPGLKHAGNDTTKAPRFYLVEASSTTPASLTALNDSITSSNSIWQARALQPGTILTLLQGDTVRYLVRNPDGSSTFIKVGGPGTFPVSGTPFPQIFNYDEQVVFESKNKFVTVFASLNQFSRPDFDINLVRGLRLFMTDSLSEPTSTSYQYQILLPFSVVNSRDISIRIPLQSLVDAGILRVAPKDNANRNRILRIRAYGYSGSVTWYGAQQPDATTRLITYPGLNTTPSQELSIKLPSEVR
jgi:hypothetical protein